MNNESQPTRLILAVLAGIAASAFGAWFWMKTNTIPPRYTFFGAGSVAIGLIVGGAVRGVLGRPDIRLAVFAGLMTAFGQAGGYYWSVWERNKLFAAKNGYTLQSINVPLSSLPPLLWPMLFVGIYVAGSLVMRKRQKVEGKK